MKDKACLAFLAAALATLFLSGCAAESAKVVEGTDLSVGFSLPGMEGEANFTLFNYLSGFKVTTSESSKVGLEYSCAETNDYFGVITTRVFKRVKAEIEPVYDAPEDEEAENQEEEPEEEAEEEADEEPPPADPSGAAENN